MKIIVAMSGGVDSSVVAAMLQAQGHEVEGIFMKNWSPETIQSLTDCPWEQDQADAAAVCEKLGIPFRSVNFEKEYKERVVDYFVNEYAAGRTPNPDVMCNKEIKFNVFLHEAEKAGADMIATGHYAQNVRHNSRQFVARGVDPKKDQSYFLWTLGQEALNKAMFPLGAMEKTEVRKLAEEFGLPTAKKKDSQGICFIGHIDLKKFLMEQITAKPGEVRMLGAGDTLSERMSSSYAIGRHDGAMFYTLGERANALIDNGVYRKMHDNRDVPGVYVVFKEGAENTLYVSDNHDDPGMYSKEVILEQWDFHEEISDEPLTFQVRYGQKEIISVANTHSSGEGLVVTTVQPMWAAAAGQSGVLYQGDRVVGGGIISKVITR